MKTVKLHQILDIHLMEIRRLSAIFSSTFGFTSWCICFFPNSLFLIAIWDGLEQINPMDKSFHNQYTIFVVDSYLISVWLVSSDQQGSQAQAMKFSNPKYFPTLINYHLRPQRLPLLLSPSNFFYSTLDYFSSV